VNSAAASSVSLAIAISHWEPQRHVRGQRVDERKLARGS
jgi:hypothetical protein